VSLDANGNFVQTGALGFEEQLLDNHSVATVICGPEVYQSLLEFATRNKRRDN
jgi:hypothetical protein